MLSGSLSADCVCEVPWVVIFFEIRVGLAMFGANNGMKRCGLRFWFWFCIEG